MLAQIPEALTAFPSRLHTPNEKGTLSALLLLPGLHPLGLRQVLGWGNTHRGWREHSRPVSGRLPLPRAWEEQELDV